MMRLLLLLTLALPAWAQNCPYVFSPPASQTINIDATASATPNTIAITAPADCNWIFGADASWITFPGAANGFGSSTGAISWVASQNVGPGSRLGHISIATNYGGNTVYTVVQAAPVCTLTLTPTSASAVVGSSTGSFQLQTNCVWGAGSEAPFLALTSATGTFTATLNYAVSPNLCVNARSGVIAAQAGGASGPIQTFQVNQAGSPGNLTVTPTSLTASPAALDGTLAIATDASCSWSAYSDVSWLSITGTSTGAGAANLAYHILANSSAQRTGSIHVGAQLFTVTQQAVPPPAVQLSAVLNGANYASGAVSPGDIVAVFGSNIGPLPGVGLQITADGHSITKSLGGVQLLFDGVPAPLLYASASQVNAIVPYAVNGSTQVQVQYQGAVSNTLTLLVQAATPGILTLDRSGFGGGAILNQDLSTNTPANPATAGSVVVIYCVGGGVTSPASVDGALIGVPAPVLVQPVSVTIGGINAPVSYSGAVPYSVAGLTQINAKVPAGLNASGPVPVIVRIGNQQSLSGATVAVQ
jgi:uncharacterized protein (TIGR03437 family)